MKIILGIVGEISAGKTTTSDYLKEKFSAQTFRFSDMLSSVLDRMYIEKKRENYQILSTIMRQNFGEDIMSKVILEDVKKADNDFIIVEGIRRPSDITYLKELPNFQVIYIKADEKTRYERIINRSEKPDDKTKTWKEFQAECNKESENKIKEIAEQADYIIDNNGSIEELHRQINEIIKK